MRVFRAVMVTLLIGIIIILSFSCTAKNNTTATPVTKISAVQKGNIAITVTGTGTLALAQTEDLAFDMAGTVDEVLVSASDSVTKGQELVKLNTSDWDNQIKTLEQKLESAQRDQQTKVSALTRAQRQITVKELAFRQAELDLKAAENNLSNVDEVNAAQAAVDKAELDLKTAQSSRDIAAKAVDADGLTYWNSQISNYYTPQLEKAKTELKAVLSGTSINISSDVALQVAKLQLQFEQSKMSVEDAQTAIVDANTAVTNAEADKADAEQAVTDAQSALDEAKNLSPIITAPFDGLITRVNVQGGNNVQKGTVALQLADPNKFEANIMVTESDIFSVKVGGTAIVSMDALSGYTFPAKITAVASTATSSQGVVNYKVTAELTSLTPIGSRGTSQSTTQSSTGSTVPTSLPSGMPTNFPSGSRPTAFPSGFPTALPDGTVPTNFPTGAFQRNRPGTNAAATDSVALKDGLTATVTITIQQKDNVLMVPSRAITRTNGNSTVQVVDGTGTKTVPVKTGLSDSTNTEITEGLSEGDQVMVKSSTTSSTSNSFGPGGGVMQGIRVP